jgi:hypothetical protein
MKSSEFRWYAIPTHDGTDQVLRRGGQSGELFAIVEPATGGWVATVNLQLAEAHHQRLECDSELEAMLAAQSWLDELIAAIDA